VITLASAPRQPVTMTLPFSVEGFADGLKAFVARAVEETAGVDEDEIGALVVGGDLVALGAQARDDALAVDQRLGAAKGNDADFGLGEGGAHLRGRIAPRGH
jgi:hypothetical protein